MWGGIGVFLIAAVVVIWVYRWRNPKCNGVPPPGSMGLPLIGETLALFVRSHSLDIHPFIRKRFQKYGPIFRTNLVGRTVVVSADPELNNRIFQGDGKITEVYYLDAFSNLFSMEGELRTVAVGQVHKYVRSLSLSYFGTESLKRSMLTQIQQLIDNTLHMWSKQASVEVKHAAAIAVGNFMTEHATGYDEQKSSLKLIEKFIRTIDGFLSVPVNIPGTAFHRCLKGKEELANVLKEMIKQRRSSPETRRGDFLDQAISDLTTESYLTEDLIIIVLYGTLYAGLESVSSAIAVAFKGLSENASVWKELKAENEAFLKSRENPDSPLTWDEYKSLTFTLQVVKETLRLTNTIPGVLRRALTDIQVKGYTIPAGWAIMAVTSSYHMNADTYKDPLAFNPWRWKELEQTNISKCFMPFGGGSRQCAGAEFSMAFLTIFLHVLVTKYSWKKIKGGNFYRNPGLSFGDGIHIKFMEKHD